MANNQSDTIPLNDPSALDYIVAGAVVLFFGLLYFYLNPHVLSAVSSTKLTQAPVITGFAFAEPSTVSTSIKPMSLSSPSLTPQVTQAVSTTVPNVQSSATQPVVQFNAVGTTPVAVPSATTSLTALALSEAELKRLREEMAKQQQLELEQLRTSMKAQQAAELERVRSELALQQAAELAQLRAEADAIHAATQAQINATLNSPRIASPSASISTSTVVSTLSERQLLPLPTGENVAVDSSEFERQLRRYLEEQRLNSPIVFDKIDFNIGSAELNMQSQEQIKVVAALMNKYPLSTILISGHTDNTGDFNMNSVLSLTRSNQMKNALVDLGIQGDRIRIEGLGPLRPIANNETEEGRRLNRRIELSLVE